MIDRRMLAAATGLFCVGVYLSVAQAQGPGGRAGPIVFPLMQALDADADGELSAKEIENATAALKTLDKDKNGKLTRDELLGTLGRFGGRGPGPGNDANAAVTAIMTYDKNGDGKLSKDELPERLKPLMDRADANKDGFLDKTELTVYAQRQGRRGPGPRRAGPAAKAMTALVARVRVASRPKLSQESDMMPEANPYPSRLTRPPEDTRAVFLTLLAHHHPDSTKVSPWKSASGSPDRSRGPPSHRTFPRRRRRTSKPRVAQRHLGTLGTPPFRSPGSPANPNGVPQSGPTGGHGESPP